MARKKKENGDNLQLSFNFDDIIESAEVLSRDEVISKYSPVEQTANYMKQVVELEKSWDTTIQKARKNLLQQNAQQLYFEFLESLTKQIESGSSKSQRLADLLEKVAVRGLGMGRNQIQIKPPLKGGMQYKVSFNKAEIEKHLETHIWGGNFLREIKTDNLYPFPTNFLIGSSDVSQHRSAVPVPARFFKHSVPFVLNNAAGTIFDLRKTEKKYENLFNPNPKDELLRWMLIDPSYKEDLDSEDYERCLASAMDVGQYRFDREYLLESDKRPNLIFRDGSLFPQDAYLDHFIVQNKRGEFTREAIREFLNCLNFAKDVGTIYCGVSKAVRLKVFSAVVDWYIASRIDRNWEVGNYTLNDAQAMTLLLSSPDFTGDNLNQVVSTCLIKRSFTTRADLNKKASGIENFDAYFDDFESKNQDEIELIKPYKALCRKAHLYMFFIGHSKTPQQQLPRYEFFYDESLGNLNDIVTKILIAIRQCGLTNDYDHSFMSNEKVVYLLPAVVQQAHKLSKDVGKYIDSATGQWITSRFKQLVNKKL